MGHQESVVREEVVEFGVNGRLTGILTRPGEITQHERLSAFVFFNAGRIHRIGPNRLYVNLARALSREGYAVLRFDHSCPDHTNDVKEPGSARPATYGMQDAQDAITFVSTETTPRRLLLFGMCSGARQAFDAAEFSSQLSGICMVNLPAGLDDRAARLEAAQKSVARYHRTQSLFNLASWRRALTGKSDYAAILQTMRGIMPGGRPHRTSALHLGNALSQRVEDLVSRGTRLLFVFSEWDPGWDYAKASLAEAMPRLQSNGAVSLERLRRSDHTFTPLAAQKNLIDLVVRWANYPGVISPKAERP